MNVPQLITIMMTVLLITGCAKQPKGGPAVESKDLDELPTEQITGSRPPDSASNTGQAVSGTSQSQANYLDKLEGILANPKEDAAQEAALKARQNELQKKSYGVDYKVTDMTAAELAKNKAQNEFNQGSKESQFNRFEINKGNIDTGVKREPMWKSEVQNMVYTLSVQLDQEQDELYGFLIKKKVAEITALAIEKKPLQEAKLEIMNQLASLEGYTLRAEKWSTAMQYALSTPLKDGGQLAGNKSTAIQLRDTHLKFIRELGEYCNEVKTLNEWVEANWERFKVRNGVRVVDSTDLQKHYQELSAKVITARKNVEQLRKNFIDRSDRFKDILTQ
jgi:hypothetical protein